jgi:hypothetical protein
MCCVSVAPLICNFYSTCLHGLQHWISEFRAWAVVQYTLPQDVIANCKLLVHTNVQGNGHATTHLAALPCTSGTLIWHLLLKTAAEKRQPTHGLTVGCKSQATRS